jgi:hypothetical protein
MSDINTRGRKGYDSSSPSKPAVALVAATTPSQEENLTNPTCMPFLLSFE